MSFEVDQIRAEFPALHQEMNHRPLVYFDNAATTQKPFSVIRAIEWYYEKDNCNIHRAVHSLGIRATEAYEEARHEIRKFINAEHSREIIFTRGTTEAINLVAHTFGKKFLGEGDEVIISVMEHHSNFVPWQQVCMERGATLRFVPLNQKGELLLDDLWRMMGKKTKLIALTHASNVLGTITPVREIIRRAHELNIPVLVDGAQAVAHISVDVRDLDADFYCFSGHKMYGPMGIGVLYGKERLLEELPPYQLGGEMIREVYFDRTTFNDLPFKFEAGTPNVEGVAGLREAVKFMQTTGLKEIGAYETDLLHYATDKLLAVGGVTIYGTSAHKASLISFNIGNIHHYDAGTLIDKMGIAVRTGHHCAMPLMEYLQVSGTIRASFALYNTFDEVDRFTEAVLKVKEMLG